MRRMLIGLPLLAASAGMFSCNPLIYDTLLEDIYVSQIALRGPTGVPTHGPIAASFPPDADGNAHVLLAAETDVSMVFLGLTPGAAPSEAYPTAEDLTALIFPIEGVQKVQIGGLWAVPSPEMGDTQEHAIAALRAPGEPENARVVRFDLPNFIRTDDDEADIKNPEIGGAPVPTFGIGLSAINLDAAQTDPDYEVAVGSQAGVLVFDNMNMNAPDYQMVKDGLGAAACEGDNEADCAFWTLCEDLASPNSLTAGPFLGGNAPALVALTEDGITMIAEADMPQTNAVGAPIYDCAKRVIAAPAGSGMDFGAGTFVNDLNDDDLDDLVVGDPSTDRVHIYFNTGSGLPDNPSKTLEPSDSEALEYGAAIGRADLGGDIGSVLLVGAPGSTVDGEIEVGKTYVYDLTGDEEILVLADTTPDKNTRFGQWVGGIHVNGRDELVLLGTSLGKVHIAINENDPAPG